jgi:hypothetical protein
MGRWIWPAAVQAAQALAQKAVVSGVADKVEVDTGAGNIDLISQ